MSDDTIPASLAPTAPVWDDAMLAMVTSDSTDETVVAARNTDIGRIEDAEWAMRRLRELQDEVNEARAMHAAWRQPIDDWLAARVAVPQARVAFLNRKLEAFGILMRQANPNTATIPLPSGDIATRQAKEPTVVIVDEDALIAWADEQLPALVYEDVVKTEQSVRVSELRKHVDIVEVEGDVTVEVDGAGNKGEPVQQPNYYRVRFTKPDGEIISVDGVEVEAPVTTAKVNPAR